MLKYIDGDLFARLPLHHDGTIYVPHIVNDANKFGAGFTAGLRRKWPVAERMYRELGLKGLRLGHTQFVLVQAEPPILVANMVAQCGVGGVRPLRYDALARCMATVRDDCHSIDGSQIHAPMFGSGLAGGSWELIELLINDFWVAANIPVTIYKL